MLVQSIITVGFLVAIAFAIHVSVPIRDRHPIA